MFLNKSHQKLTKLSKYVYLGNDFSLFLINFLFLKILTKKAKKTNKQTNKNKQKKKP